MLKFYCAITGDDYQMLNSDTPASRKKVTILATVIFIPVLIWFMNGYLLVTHVLHGSTGAGLIAASIMALLIFLIEKNIIMANGSNAITWFRVILGFIVAMLGAICLDEVVFKQDIDQQLYVINQKIIDENLTKTDAKFLPEMTKKEKEVDEKYRIWIQAQEIAQKEADGTSGSGIKGVHAITRMKLSMADSKKEEYYAAKKELESLKTKLAESRLEIQKQLEASLSDSALLNRIKALFNLVFHDWFMGIIYFLFTAFIFCMEFLVVFLKSNLKETNYERRIELIEEIGRKRMEKILVHDPKNYDPGKVHQSYARAKDSLLNGSSSFYN